jgi:hypothetical protein
MTSGDQAWFASMTPHPSEVQRESNGAAPDGLLLALPGLLLLSGAKRCGGMRERLMKT